MGVSATPGRSTAGLLRLRWQLIGWRRSAWRGSSGTVTCSRASTSPRRLADRLRGRSSLEDADGVFWCEGARIAHSLGSPVRPRHRLRRSRAAPCSRSPDSRRFIGSGACPGANRRSCEARRRMLERTGTSSPVTVSSSASEHGTRRPPDSARLPARSSRRRSATSWGHDSERARTSLRRRRPASCCEDTRTTGRLLSLLGIGAPKMISLHDHNERERLPEIVERLELGAKVGLVCDAGTPLLSDPGARVVGAAIGAGVSIVVRRPGAPGCARRALKSSPDSAVDGSAYEGFLPRKGAERGSVLIGSRAVASLDAGAWSTRRRAEWARRSPIWLASVAICGGSRSRASSPSSTRRRGGGTLGDAVPPHRRWSPPRGEYVIVLDGAGTVEQDPVDLGRGDGRPGSSGIAPPRRGGCGRDTPRCHPMCGVRRGTRTRRVRGERVTPIHRR